METREILLLRNLRRGDRFTFEFIFKNYHKKLFRIALVILKDEELALETVNDVFLNIWEKRKSIEIKKNLEAYLVVKTKSYSLNSLRKKVKRQAQYSENHLELLNEEMAFYQEEDIISKLIADDIQLKYKQAINSLPGQQQKIYKLSRAEGLTAGEIAERTNIAQRTVETHLYKALKTIKEQLKVILE